MSERVWPGVVFLVVLGAVVTLGMGAMAHASTGRAEWRARLVPGYLVMADNRSVRVGVVAVNTGTSEGPADCEVWGFGKPGEHIATGDGLTATAWPGQTVRVMVPVVPDPGHGAREVTAFSVACW